MIQNFIFDLQRFDFSGGDGSENNPYLISSANDLAQLATDVNSGNDYSGKYFKVTADIDLKDVTYTAIGNADNKFKGTFDGDGKTISNLTSNDENANYQGLFGHVENATIKNVNLTGVNVKGGNHVGVLVGYVNNSTISNCHAQEGSVIGTGRVGFIGHLRGNNNGSTTVDGCSFSGDVEGTGAGSLVGGVVGWNNGGIIKNSAFLGGTLTGSYKPLNIGAIAGTISQGGGKFENNYYSGTLADGVDDNGATQVYKLKLSDGVTASDATTAINGVNYYSGTVTISGFDSADASIQVLNAPDTPVTLAISGNYITAGSLTLTGLTLATETNAWSFGDTAASFNQNRGVGAYINSGTTVNYNATEDSSNIFTINGLGQSAYLTPDTSAQVVTVGESALWARKSDTITIDNNYTFALEPEPTIISNGTTEITADGVYQFAEGYTGTLTISATNVKLIGAGSPLSNTYINVTANDANL